MIINSILPVDIERGTRDLVEAAKTTAAGKMLVAEDLSRLLVWHTPRFVDYARVKAVLNAAIASCAATGLRVIAIAPRLFQIALYPRGLSGLKDPAASVLVELNNEGHAIAAEPLVQDSSDPLSLSMVYAMHKDEAKAEEWLDKLSASWKRGSVPFKFQPLAAERGHFEPPAKGKGAPAAKVPQPGVGKRRKAGVLDPKLLIKQAKSAGELRGKAPAAPKAKHHPVSAKKQRKISQQESVAR